MFRRKIAIYWIALALSSLATAALAFWFIEKENRRKRFDSEHRINNAIESASAIVSGYWIELREEACKQLISFHEEGLKSSLVRWRNSNDLIEEVFLHDPLRRDNSTNPLNEYTRSFLARVENGGRNTLAIIPLDDAENGSAYHQGYYEENVEIAAYGGKIVRPELIWGLIETDSGARWVIAHRIDPSLPLRGAILDDNHLLHLLQSLAANQSQGNLQIRLNSQQAPSEDPAFLRKSKVLAAIFPQRTLEASLSESDGHVITLESLSPWLVGVCVTLTVICGSLIILYANREYRQARRKTTFVSQVSHELKTPLTSISLHAELLEDPNLQDSRRSQYSDLIARECQRLTQMIDNLLSLSSIECNAKTYSIQEIDTLSIVQEVVQELSPAAKKRSLKLVVSEPSKPTSAKGDCSIVRQALLNLIDNAFKYASPARTLSIEFERTHRNQIISVTDDGPGVPHHARRQIFESFYQANSGLSNKSPGAGLGLSIARKTLRETGGDLTLDSSYTHGACFIIQLPLP